MITIEIKEKEKTYVQFLVKGHAGSGQYGEDIVCAGVSAVVYGILNTLMDAYDRKEISYELRDGFTKIDILKSSTRTQILCEALDISLCGIYESYDTYVSYTKKNV